MTPPEAEPARTVASESAEVVSPRTRRGQLLLGGMTVGHFSHHVSNSLLNPLLPLIRDSFVLSYAQSGFLVSAFSLALGLSNAPIGYLADRIGSRPVIVSGLVLTGLISAWLALVGDYWQFLVLLVLLGIVAGSYHAPASALIAQVFPASSRGAVMGLHITGGHLSYFATPLLAALLVSFVGTWRAPYLYFAIIPIVLGVVIWYLTPRVRVAPTAAASGTAVFRELGEVVRTAGPVVSLSVVFQVFQAALLAFTALYLVDVRDVPAALAAAAFGVPHLAGIVCSPLAGLLSDRFGRRAVILIGVAALGPAWLSLSLLPTELLPLSLIAIGIAAALRLTVTEVFVTESAPAHRRATYLGGYYMLSQELGGLAAPLLGLLASAVGIGAAFGSVSLSLTTLSVLVVLFQQRLR
jgi:MFS family permease